MTSDSIRPPEQRYNYSNALSGCVDLVKSEGVKGLTRGLGTNVVSSLCCVVLLFAYHWLPLLRLDKSGLNERAYKVHLYTIFLECTDIHSGFASGLVSYLRD